MYNKERVIVIEDGMIVGLHDESLGLEELGEMVVRRASNVEFDGERQVWYVEDARTNERLFEDRLRSACLDWERDHFNRKLAEGLSPFAQDDTHAAAMDALRANEEASFDETGYDAGR